MNEIIKKRRACRSFDSNKPVESEKIQEIVNAGLLAPTGMNKQETVVLIVENKEKREGLANLNAGVIGWKRDPFYGAPVVLVVIAKKSPFADLDGAAMIMSMLLEATNQGLGSCWIHRAKEVLETEEGKMLFAETGLDLDEYVGVGNIALGYASKAIDDEKAILPNRAYYLK